MRISFIILLFLAMLIKDIKARGSDCFVVPQCNSECAGGNNIFNCCVGLGFNRGGFCQAGQTPVCMKKQKYDLGKDIQKALGESVRSTNCLP